MSDANPRSGGDADARCGAFGFRVTIYNSDQGARGAHYGDPGGQAHAVGAGERGKNAGAPRNHVSIYSGVMPGAREVLPPPASLFKTAKPKTAKAAPASR